jgi:glycogen operon protein
MTTLLFSQGVPMIAHGDEIGRSQCGNNNVYCQDNEIAWMDWDLDDEAADMLAFTQQVVALRLRHPVFRRRRFFRGRADHGGENQVGDIAWFTPSGAHMTEQDWANGFARSVSVFLNGDAILEPDDHGQQVIDDSFLILFNAHYEPLTFTLPMKDYGLRWSIVLDTSGVIPPGRKTRSRAKLSVSARSMVVLKRPQGVEEPVATKLAKAARLGRPVSSLEGMATADDLNEVSGGRS